jgi:hypothetical protein
MFALRVTYLTGRVYCSRFEDGDEKLAPEWPPHPGRLGRDRFRSGDPRGA